MANRSERLHVLFETHNIVSTIETYIAEAGENPNVQKGILIAEQPVLRKVQSMLYQAWTAGELAAGILTVTTDRNMTFKNGLVLHFLHNAANAVGMNPDFIIVQGAVQHDREQLVSRIR